MLHQAKIGLSGWIQLAHEPNNPLPHVLPTSLPAHLHPRNFPNGTPSPSPGALQPRVRPGSLSLIGYTTPTPQALTPIRCPRNLTTKKKENLPTRNPPPQDRRKNNRDREVRAFCLLSTAIMISERMQSPRQLQGEQIGKLIHLLFIQHFVLKESNSSSRRNRKRPKTLHPTHTPPLSSSPSSQENHPAAHLPPSLSPTPATCSTGGETPATAPSPASLWHTSLPRRQITEVPHHTFPFPFFFFSSSSAFPCEPQDCDSEVAHGLSRRTRISR